MKAPDKPIDKKTEAFKEGFNLIGLAGAIALSAGLLNPLPLIVAGVFEVAYMLFVPDSRWFDRRLATKYDAEVVRRREELKSKVYPTLTEDVQTRFSRLEVMRSQIGSQEFEGKRWYREVLRKLDYLMEKFLLFASKQVQFQNYLISVQQELAPTGPNTVVSIDSRKPRRRDVFAVMDDAWVRQTVADIRASYAREIQGIEGELGSDENLHNQAILEKRKEVLDRRNQYVVRIGEILENLGHQLRLMEDTFGLINDEIRARSPEQVLADIDDVVNQTDNLTETLENVAPFEVMTAA